MARPRVFISSTFYDLKHVRNDLDNFLKTIGYESIMNDKGHIPYSREKPLENNCYDEVTRCDILIGIIGSNYGTSSTENDEYSISMAEIRTAIKNNKQVFVFVEKPVLNENRLFIENKNNQVTYVAVNDIKIHKFIEEIQSLRINNAMIPFESVSEITDYLKEQFAGLFQRLLQDKATITEQTTYYDLKETIDDLKSIVDKINSENNDFTNKFESTMFAPNRVLKLLRSQLGITKVQFFAKDKESLFELLELMSFSEENMIDNSYAFTKDNIMLMISEEVFDEYGKIKNFRDLKKIDELISVLHYKDEDLIPF